MQCDCTSLVTGGKTSSSVNLSRTPLRLLSDFHLFAVLTPFFSPDDRINVNEEGWLTC